MTRPPDNPAPDTPPTPRSAGFVPSALGLMLPADIAPAERESPAAELAERAAAVTQREAACQQREAELDARERMNKVLLWLAIATLVMGIVGALGAWGGPVLQVLIEHALSDAAAGGTVPPAP